ncbi:MAG: class I SAM-dependent methyltransferase [Methanocellales archaeon]
MYKMIYFGREIYIDENVYPPSEDTFLLLKAALEEVKRGEFVLEIGTGCGIIANFLKEKARVIATDINPHAVKCAKANGIEVVRTDLLAGLKPQRQFDVIIFNPPYLPESESNGSWLGKAWSGGRVLIDRFLNETPNYLNENGRILLVVSSITGVEDVKERMQSLGFKINQIARERYFFEEIMVLVGRQINK